MSAQWKILHNQINDFLSYLWLVLVNSLPVGMPVILKYLENDMWICTEQKGLFSVVVYGWTEWVSWESQSSSALECSAIEAERICAPCSCLLGLEAWLYPPESYWVKWELDIKDAFSTMLLFFRSLID